MEGPPPKYELPKPMTEEMRRKLIERTGVDIEEERLRYGDWLGSWEWYHQKFPGFSIEQCKCMELYSNGVRAKEHKALIKKERKHVQHREEELAKAFTASFPVRQENPPSDN